MWTPPINESAELTRGALYLIHYSEGRIHLSILLGRIPIEVKSHGWPVSSRSPGLGRCGWCSVGGGSCGTPPLSPGAAARRRRVAATHVQPADMRTSLNFKFLKHYEEIGKSFRVFLYHCNICQCLGSGSVLIWLSWIRIRIVNANSDPDKWARKLAKIN
jgi:hypothetical protein